MLLTTFQLGSLVIKVMRERYIYNPFITLLTMIVAVYVILYDTEIRRIISFYYFAALSNDYGASTLLTFPSHESPVTSHHFPIAPFYPLLDN